MEAGKNSEVDGLIFQVAPVDGLKDQQSGHDLGGAGDVQLRVDVLLIEDGVRPDVHQQGGLGPDGRVFQTVGGDGGEGGQQNGQQKKR